MPEYWLSRKPNYCTCHKVLFPYNVRGEAMHSCSFKSFFSHVLDPFHIFNRKITQMVFVKGCPNVCIQLYESLSLAFRWDPGDHPPLKRDRYGRGISVMLKSIWNFNLYYLTGVKASSSLLWCYFLGLFEGPVGWCNCTISIKRCTETIGVFSILYMMQYVYLTTERGVGNPLYHFEC